nr:AbrB family transcriptional regulator [uncultured Oscillibacter sp.]
MLTRLLITLLIGAAGAWALYKLRVPAGAMAGAILLVGIFQIATGYGYFPRFVKTCVQAVAGGFVGQRISRSDLKELRSIGKPSLQLFGGIVFLTFCTGLLIHHTAPVDTATALLSSMPGGMTDVALISADVGADPAQSTALQLVRYLIAILILPQLDARICARFAPEKQSRDAGDLPGGGRKLRDGKHMAITLAIVALAGALGKLSGFPAGAMVLPMFAVAAYNIRSGEAYLPKGMKLAAQCLAGVNIGVTITLADILHFRELALPAVMVAVNCVAVNYVLGFLLYKTNDLDLPTSLFASVPAGMSDMALVSLEQGGEAPKVAVLQLVRYLCAMAFMPAMIKLFAGWYPL